MKRRLIAVVLTMSMAVPAPLWAGDRAIVLDVPGAPALQLPRAESGKPLIPLAPPGVASRAILGDPERCATPLPCGTRLLGTVRKDGAVEVQLPALRW